MSDKIIENNKVTIIGEIAGNLYSAMKFSEKAFIW